MPEQFVNPAPQMNVQGVICFDFPCEGDVSIDVNSTYRNANAQKPSLPNFNLAATGVERTYGTPAPLGLGNPKKQQGHPYISEKEIGATGYGEPEDPNMVDQIVDADRGMYLCHTGRLSGSIVPMIVLQPNFSIVKVTAMAVSPVPAANQQITIEPGIKRWLLPQPMASNVWFWRPFTTTNELLFSAEVEINQALSSKGFMAEAVYKLVYYWEFWKIKTGPGGPLPPYPPDPPDPGNTQWPCERLAISGFDESIAFQVSTATP